MPVVLQDVELHRRLLQQLYKDSLAFHNVFFGLTQAQKVAIISTDRKVKSQRKIGRRYCTQTIQPMIAFKITPLLKLFPTLMSKVEQYSLVTH